MSIPSAPIKTPLGQDELRHRTRGLGQRYRTVLLLVDGRRPLGDVLAMAHQAGAQTSHFEELVRLGLVELPQAEALPEVMETAPGALDIPKLTSVVLDVHLPDLVIEPVVASAEPSVPLHELPVLSSWVPAQDTAWPDLPPTERPVLSLAVADAPAPAVAPAPAPAAAPATAAVPAPAPAQKPPASPAKAKSQVAAEAPRSEPARSRAAEPAAAKPAPPEPAPAPAKAASSDEPPARKPRRSSRRSAAASIEPVLSDATPIHAPDPASTPRFEPLLDEPVELQTQDLSKPTAPAAPVPRVVMEPPPAQAPVKKRQTAAAPSPSQRVVPTLTHQQPAADWLQVRAQPLAMALEAEQDEEASEQILQQVRSLLTHALGGDAALFAPLVLSRVRSAPTARALIGLVWEIERHRGHIRRGRLQLLSLERARDLLGMGNTLVAGDSQAGGSDWPDTQQ